MGGVGKVSDFFFFSSKIKGKAFLDFAWLRLCEGGLLRSVRMGKQHCPFHSSLELGLPDLRPKKKKKNEDTQFNLL